MAEDIHKIDYPEDPDRCQGVYANGQCPNKAVKGGTFCKMHGGSGQLRAQEKIRKSNYQLTRWQAQVDKMTDSSEIKSIRDEIGILRMVLEEKLNALTTPTDLLMSSRTIALLVDQIQKTVVSCHKLESSMGQLLDKQAIISFATELIAIIKEELDDQPEKMEAIANKIIATAARKTTNEDDK